jgi:hypothetical protein
VQAVEQVPEQLWVADECLVVQVQRADAQWVADVERWAVAE